MSLLLSLSSPVVSTDEHPRLSVNRPFGPYPWNAAKQLLLFSHQTDPTAPQITTPSLSVVAFYEGQFNPRATRYTSPVNSDTTAVVVATDTTPGSVNRGYRPQPWSAAVQRGLFATPADRADAAIGSINRVYAPPVWNAAKQLSLFAQPTDTPAVVVTSDGSTSSTPWKYGPSRWTQLYLFNPSNDQQTDPGVSASVPRPGYHWQAAQAWRSQVLGGLQSHVDSTDGVQGATPAPGFHWKAASPWSALRQLGLFSASKDTPVVVTDDGAVGATPSHGPYWSLSQPWWGRLQLGLLQQVTDQQTVDAPPQTTNRRMRATYWIGNQAFLSAPVGDTPPVLASSDVVPSYVNPMMQTTRWNIRVQSTLNQPVEDTVPVLPANSGYPVSRGRGGYF